MTGKFAAAPRGGGSARAAITYILHEELAAKTSHAQWNDPLQAGQREHVSALMEEARKREDFGAGAIWKPQSGDGLRPSAIYARGVISLQTAAAEMEGVARTQPRVKQPVSHLIISLNEAETKTVSDEQLIRAAERAVDKAGFQNHQAIFAVHRDTENAHCHVAVGSINPRTLHAYNRANNFARLHWALREAEQHFHMEHDRGLAIVRDPGLATERIDWADARTRKGWEREREGERLEDMARSFLAESDGLESPEDRRDRVIHALRDYLADCRARKETPLRADLHTIAARLTATLESHNDTLHVRLMEKAVAAEPTREATNALGDSKQRFARWQATDTVFPIAPAVLAPSPLDAIAPDGRTTTYERAEHAAAIEHRTWLRNLGTVARSEEEVIAVIRQDPGRISRDLVAGGAATFTAGDVDEWCAQRVTADWMQLSDFAQRTDPTIKVLSAATETPLYTTSAQLALEQNVVQCATRLAQEYDPLFDRDKLRQAIAEEEAALGVKFSDEQLRVCDLLQYRFALVQGDAGTGKSTLMAVQRRYCELTGREIAGFATSQLAAENLGEKTGIRSRNTARAQILESARGEAMIPTQSRAIFDEASMLSLESVSAGLERIENQNASAMFILDLAQLPNLAAGDTGRILSDVAKSQGRYAEVTQVFRQTGDAVRWMREAVPLGGRAIREADAFAFRTYLQEFVDRGHVVFHDDRAAEISAKARDVADAIRRGERVLAPGRSRQDCLYTSRAIREQLGLKGRGLTFALHRGMRELAAGDRVIFEKNAESRLGVLNGYLGTVRAVTRHAIDIELDSGRVVTLDPKTYPHLDYGFSTTTHKSQGRGDPLVVPTLGKGDDARSAHVALTRCETGLRVHTRLSRDELLEHLTSTAALRPKDDALLFDEIVRQTGGPDTTWARAVRDAMERETSPLRSEHRQEMATRTKSYQREIVDILARNAAARETASPADSAKIEKREKRELEAAGDRHRLESFVVWASKNKRRIEDDGAARAQYQKIRNEHLKASKREAARNRAVEHTPQTKKKQGKRR